MKRELVEWARTAATRQGHALPEAFFGISTLQAATLRDKPEPWLYFDHSYFNRGWRNRVFRCTARDVHLTRLLKRRDDRLRKFGVEIRPWRKTGRKIVVIPLSPYQERYYGAAQWNDEILRSLAAVTDRAVNISLGKTVPLEEQLSDAWAVVTYSSAAGVGAALMGVPVFSTKCCPSYPVNAGPIEKIDTPEYSECRHEMACGLAYASWHVEEMNSIRWHNYEYEAL